MNAPAASNHGSFKQDLNDISRHAGEVGAGVSSLARDGVHAVRDGAGEIAAGASNAVDAAKARLEKGSEYVKKQYDNAKESVGGAARSVTETVREHPVASIAVAVGLGMIAGVLLGRSRS
jgi:ElaB/YqjD/DUF883 family membrane-anchored ribosome-binding protein